MVLDGEAIQYVDRLFGEPQGPVLGPVLFLLLQNDLPDELQFNVLLFADDFVLYKVIKTPQ